jgi:acyl dehydratase|tara:strand:+ start:908 stop:1408 length:501 start_codon:yes stop_codon:yes gene_type:complete
MTRTPLVFTNDSPTTQLGGEDLVPGEEVTRRKILLDDRAFADFAALTGDSHPIHYDVEYAHAIGLQAPIAHGLLITAMTALGATPLSERLQDSMIAMLSIESQFQSPVFVGSMITVVIRVASVEKKTDNRCVAAFDIEVQSAAGELHARVTHRYMLRTSIERDATS